MDSCRFFGGTLQQWEDELTMDLLAAQQKSLMKRPPVEFYAAGYFDYEAPGEGVSAEVELPEALPLYEP